MVSVHILAFSIESGKWEVEVCVPASSQMFHENKMVDSKNQLVHRISRDLSDFQALHRLSRCSEGIPIKVLRKMQSPGEISWEVGTEGWQYSSYKRGVSTFQRWLELALNSLSNDELNSFLDNEANKTRKKLKLEQKGIEAKPRALQQYFASEANIAKVVQYATHNIMTQSSGNVIFVEPSCGDGRILRKLLESGAKHVVGIDIDSEAAGQASCLLAADLADKHSQHNHSADNTDKPFATGTINTNLNNDVQIIVNTSDAVTNESIEKVDDSSCCSTGSISSNPWKPSSAIPTSNVKIYHEDFLLFRRETLLRDTGKDRGCVATACNSSTYCGCEPSVVVVGGPPFTIVPSALADATSRTTSAIATTATMNTVANTDLPAVDMTTTTSNTHTFESTHAASTGTGTGTGGMDSVPQVPAEAPLVPPAILSFDITCTSLATPAAPTPSPASTTAISAVNNPPSITSSSNRTSIDYSAYAKDAFPLLFLQHAAVELQATRVVFILPERCGRPTFIEQAASAMNRSSNSTSSSSSSSSSTSSTSGSSTSNSTTRPSNSVQAIPATELQPSTSTISSASDRSNCDNIPMTINKKAPGSIATATDTSLGTYTNDHSGSHWQLIRNEVADSRFHLLDKEIKQPAVIQVWQRNT